MGLKKDRYRKLFMGSAELASTMSFCKRLKVGAVLVKDNRILLNSWNGTTNNRDNCCEKKINNTILSCNQCGNIEDYNGEQDVLCRNCSTPMEIDTQTKLETLSEVIHAEKNIIAYAAKEGISTNKCTLYVTVSPCMNCAILLKASGIKKVFYRHKYRSDDGIDFLESVGIKVKQLI